MTVSALGDSAVVLTLGETVDQAMAVRVQAIATELRRRNPAGLVDVVPAFASVAVFFDPAHAGPLATWEAELRDAAGRAEAALVTAESRMVEVPVLYGGDAGPDLAAVAARAQLSTAAAATLHASAEYLVHAIGFAPGFPYLGGLPPKLATPRRATPRPRVPAGSVGIGGAQTGVYPLEVPGGWNLIGRTPLKLFDPTRAEPALLQAGDRVRFRAIASEEFEETVERDERRRLSASAPTAGAMPGIELMRGGMFTTVQDTGRRGHRARGLPLGGAADAFALRLANLLVGNSEDAGALEFTLVGPELRFLHDTVVAIAGAEFDGVPRGRPLAVRAGETLKLGPAVRGCRGYLAVAGGIDVPLVLDSRSTYARAGLGGWQGRALRDGDVLPVPLMRRTLGEHWHIDERIVPGYSSEAVVRVLAAAHEEEFEPGWLGRTFKVSTHSDRMGVRLAGEAVRRRSGGELLSVPVAPGTIQVPPDGQPIVLLAEAQTIGGYPQLAHVITVDLPLVAQLRPGDQVRFARVTLDEARELIVIRERALALLREGIAQKLA